MMLVNGVDVEQDPLLRWVREGVIGRGVPIHTPFGVRPKRYFDQTASGLPFGPIEDMIRDQILPYMANTHTEASYTGRFMTTQFEGAHARIRAAFRAREDDVMLFVGSGCTGAINRLIATMGLRLPERMCARSCCRWTAARWWCAAGWSTTPTTSPGARRSP